MPWLVGIDEAGYGPNLGPFVMTSVACRVPVELANPDLWQVLRAAVRRGDDPTDDRILIEDSKVVYSPARGLGELERGVLGTVLTRAARLRECLERACLSGAGELEREPWFTGETSLPAEIGQEQVGEAAERFRRTCRENELTWGPVRCVIVCPPRFNDFLDRCGTKGAVLAHGLTELVGRAREPDAGAEPVQFHIDKHGGRNNYAPLIQDAVSEGFVVARTEGRDRSEYDVLGLSREVRLTFQPRADATHLCVALASMVSKYLRELLMQEFNQFWRKQVPDLEPTAGYPVDAARFYDAIRPAADRLGIPTAALWRKK